MGTPLVSRALSPAVSADGSRILVLAFDSQSLACSALQAAFGLQDDDKLVVHDAVVFSGHAAGAEIIATMDPTPVAAAVPASLAGALIGTLVAGPLGLLVGGALAGGMGALVAKLAGTGISGQMIAELRDAVQPGQCVVALLVSELSAVEMAAFAMRCGAIGRSTIVPLE